MIGLMIAAALSTTSLEYQAATQPLPLGRFRFGSGFSERVTVGFLVGPCEAMTTRQLTANARPIGQTVRFESSAGVSSGVVIEAGAPTSDPLDYSGDWLLVKLEKCQGESIGHLPIATSLSATSVIAAAYISRKSDPRLELCKISSYSSKIVYSTCNLFSLEGGTPLLSVDPFTKRLVVTAILTGSYEKQNVSVAAPLYTLSAADRHRISSNIAMAQATAAEKRP